MSQGAEIKLLALEQELFEQLRGRLANEMPRLQTMAQTVALLDVLAGLAETAALHRYVKPLVDESQHDPHSRRPTSCRGATQQ